MCTFRQTQKRIIGPRFAGFRGRKEREIQNWICNRGNLSQTRAIYMTAFQEMNCQLSNYGVIWCRILWSAIRKATMEHKQIKKEAF